MTIPYRNVSRMRDFLLSDFLFFLFRFFFFVLSSLVIIFNLLFHYNAFSAFFHLFFPISGRRWLNATRLVATSDLQSKLPNSPVAIDNTTCIVLRTPWGRACKLITSSGSKNFLPLKSNSSRLGQRPENLGLVAFACSPCSRPSCVERRPSRKRFPS